MSQTICFSWTIGGSWMTLQRSLFYLGVSNVGRNELKQRLMGSNPAHYVDVVPCTYSLLLMAPSLHLMISVFFLGRYVYCFYGIHLRKSFTVFLWDQNHTILKCECVLCYMPPSVMKIDKVIDDLPACIHVCYFKFVQCHRHVIYKMPPFQILLDLPNPTKSRAANITL